MATNRIILDPIKHASFIAEKRKDPITKEILVAGMEIVICEDEGIAFEASNWQNSCPHCNCTNSLTTIPITRPIHLQKTNTVIKKIPNKVKESFTSKGADANSPNPKNNYVYIISIIVIFLLIILFSFSLSNKGEENPESTDNNENISSQIQAPTNTIRVPSKPTATEEISNSTEPTGNIVFSCNDDEGFAQICIIDAADGIETKITSFASAASTYPFLTSDGKNVLFTSNKSVDHAIYILSLKNNQLTQVSTPGGDKAFPQLSPNGLWITFTDVNDKKNNIYLMKNDGSNITEIYHNGSRAVWSNNSTKLAFICFDQENQPQICIMDITGNNVKQITNLKNLGQWIGWSPDGEEFVFSIGKKEDKNRKICSINIDGSDYKILYDSFDSIEPSYSPDGKWIVFLNYLNKNVTGRGEIFIMRNDGTDIRQLTNNDRNDWLPQWGN